MMLADIAIAVLLAVLLSDVMFPGDKSMFWAESLPQPVYALALLVSAWVLTLWVHGAYRLRTRWSITSEVRVLLRALVVFGLVSFSFLYLAKIPDVSRGYMIVLLGVLLAGAIGVRVLMRWFFEHARVRGKNVRSLLVLGTGPQGRSFATKLAEHPELGLRILGFLGEPTNELPARWPYLGTIDALPDFIHGHVVDEVAVCLVTEDWALIKSVTSLCESEGKIVRMPVPMPRLSIATSHVEDLDGTPVLTLLTGPRSSLAFGGKRALDLVGRRARPRRPFALAPRYRAGIDPDGRATGALPPGASWASRPALQPVQVPIMVKDADAQLEGLRSQNEIKGHAFKLKADPRVTKVGLFLRRSSLDELPSC